MGIVAWSAIVFFALAELWVLTLLLVLGLKRYLPFEEAVVREVTLGEVNMPKTQQVFLSVKYRIANDEHLLRIAFFGGSKQRALRSGRYRRLTQFYGPGARFRIYKPPRWCLLEHIPECPVIRVETVFLLTAAFVFACILTGFALAQLSA